MYRFHVGKWLAVMVLASLGLAACGGAAAAQSPTSAPPTATALSTQASSGNHAQAGSLKVANSSLGKILVDSQGVTLYMLTADSSDQSTCTAACAGAWPPMIVQSAPSAEAGLQASLITTIVRPDGSEQAAYNGHPLYYFKGDTKPGDVKGEGIQSFGGTWYALSPQGQPVLNNAPSGGGY